MRFRLIEVYKYSFKVDWRKKGAESSIKWVERMAVRAELDIAVIIFAIILLPYIRKWHRYVCIIYALYALHNYYRTRCLNAIDQEREGNGNDQKVKLSFATFRLWFYLWLKMGGARGARYLLQGCVRGRYYYYLYLPHVIIHNLRH